MGGGEWFLVALVEAYLIIGVLFQVKRFNRYLICYSHLIAVVLFIIHIPIRIVLAKLCYNADFLLDSFVVRNTWLDAIPFMLLGLTIRRNSFSRIKHPIVISISGLIISILECYITIEIIKPQKMSSVLYFGTIVSVVFAFLWAIGNKGNESVLSKIGEYYSMLVFFIHPIIGQLFQSITNGALSTSLVLQCLCSLIIIVLSTIVASVLYKIGYCLKSKKDVGEKNE